MIILAIETSCDDTGIAVIKASGGKRPNFKILANIVSSQTEIHSKWGGVYPTLAKREHQKNLAPVLERALREAGMLKKSVPTLPTAGRRQAGHAYRQAGKSQNLESILKREEGLYHQLEKFLKRYENPKVAAIAVTVGPGLEPCLWVGVNFAKALSYYWDIPIIQVNHIEAHIIANFIDDKLKTRKLKLETLFPAVSLIVSGGHTQLILMKGFGKYKVLGETRDDAAGECFDKTAKILGLSYPGGPAMSAAAAKAGGGAALAKLPRPMMKSADYDFSFSGLKTAVLYYHKKQQKKVRESKKYINEMSCEIQQAIIDVLISKLMRAAKEHRAKSIILGGGVAANKELRKQLGEKIKKEISNIQYLIPDIQLCTDNAAMIGAAAYFRWQKGEKKNWKGIRAKANLRIK